MDDIFTTASSPNEMEAFKALLKLKWEILDLSPIKFMLGITISHNLPSQTISIHQENLKILFYTFLHFFVKKLKKYEKDKSFTCQTTF